MKVKFWGVRGSLPAPLTTQELSERLVTAVRDLDRCRPRRDQARRFVHSLPEETRTTVGGNTPCVEVRTNTGVLIVLDAGSGIRLLGEQLMQESFGEGSGHAWLLFSHTHWDHIHGFPFFTPAYVKGNVFYICGRHLGLEDRLRDQHDPRYFPVPFDALSASIRFRRLKANDWIANRRVRVRSIRLHHPGESFAYRIEADGASVVYATDGEYQRLDAAAMTKYMDFFHDADLLIFDSMYTVIESIEKADWGHSSAVVGVELATQAKVKTLALFHHNPASSDAKVRELLEYAKRYQDLVPAPNRPSVIVAREGREIELAPHDT